MKIVLNFWCNDMGDNLNYIKIQQTTLASIGKGAKAKKRHSRFFFVLLIAVIVVCSFFLYLGMK